MIAPPATTGVGSLPFSDAPTAVRHAVRAYDIPFCPQLPAHDGDMIRDWLGADPRRCGWSAGRDRERPTAWEAFLAACAEHDRRLVKLQVTGPVTLAVALERAAGRRGQGTAWGVIDPAAPERPDAVAARARACLACLASTGVPPERSLLTPSCGTGRLSPARERLVAAVLGAAAELVSQASSPSATM